MPRLLLIHLPRSAAEREAGRVMVRWLASAGIEVDVCMSTPGLWWLDDRLAGCDGIVLVEPSQWWLRSPADDLARPWLTRIRDHIEFDRRSELDRVAVIVDRPLTNPIFSAARRIRSSELQALADWVGGFAVPDRALDFGLGPAIPGDRPRDDLLAAIDAGLRGSSLVVVAGALGTGKSRLLREWVRRQRPPAVVAHHFALPEHGATLRAEWAERSLAAQLGSSPAGSATVVIDGVERLDEPERLLAAVAPRGAKLVVGTRWWQVAESDGAHVIDLAAQKWGSTATLIRSLAGESGLDEAGCTSLVERAGGFVGFMAGLPEAVKGRSKTQLLALTRAAQPGQPPAIPHQLGLEIDRELGRLAASAREQGEWQQSARGNHGYQRARGELILDLLALTGDPVPAGILLACLESTASLAEVLEPIRGLVHVRGSAEDQSVELLHPVLAELRRYELDDRPRQEAILLAGLDRVRSGSRPQSVDSFAAVHAPALRRSLSAMSGVLTDIDQLIEQVLTRGSLDLERDLADQGDGLPTDLLAILRSCAPTSADSRATLQTLVWNSLLDRGWSTEELETRLRWPGGPPRIRLRRPLEHVDQCWRTLRHPDGVHGCAISSDGARILTACDDGRVRVWSRATGREVSSFEHGGLARSCAMTPDGEWAVSGGMDQSLKRWVVRTGASVGEHSGDDHMIRDVAISDDGRRVIAGDQEGHVLGWRHGEKVVELGRHGSPVAGVAIAADGKFAISGGGKASMLWNLDTHQQHRPAALPDHEYTMNGVAIMRHGRIAYDTSIDATRRLSIVDAEVEARFPNLCQNVSCTAPMSIATPAGPSDRLLVGRDKRLAVWDVSTGTVAIEVHAHDEDVAGCATTADGEWSVSVSDDRTAKVWAAAAFRPANPGARWVGKRQIVESSPNGARLLVGGDERTLSIVDVASGRVTGTLDIDSRPTGLAWIDDDRVVVVTGTSHEVMVWSVDRREKLAGRELGGDWLRDVAVSPDGTRLLLCGDQKTPWLIEPDLKQAKSLGTLSDWGWKCAFASNGKAALVVDRDGELWSWAVPGGGRNQKLKSEKNYSYASLAVAGALAFAGGPSTLDVWDLGSGTLASATEGLSGNITALRVVQGRVLVSAAGSTLGFWTVAGTPKLLATVTGHAPFNAITEANGLLLVGDDAGNVWELEVDWQALKG